MYNTNEEKLIVKGSERITRDLLVNHDAYINGGIEANNVTTNELNVANMVAGGATVNDLNVINQVENLNVANLVGNNIVEGENRVVNNAILGMDTQSVVFWNNTANQFQTLPVPYADNVVLTGNVDGSLRWAIGGGGNVNGAPVVVMNESYFTDVLDYNVDNGWDNSVLYMTTPNGNFFFGNYFYAPTAVYVSPTVVTMVFNNTNYSGNVTLTLSNPDAVTNAFLGSSSIISATYKNGQPASIGVNMSLPNSCVTNAKYLYVENAAYAFNNSRNMTDCFFFNGDLIENRPSGYNPWNMITNASHMFFYCYNLNESTFIIPQNAVDISEMYTGCGNVGWSNTQINIPDTVENMTGLFQWCGRYNSPITIGNNVTNMANTFANCYNFNQPITISNSVEDMSYTFANCNNFNQPITIGNNVIDMSNTFLSSVFNQPITIPDSVVNLDNTFAYSRFNSPITIGNNVTSMNMTFQHSYFNQPITIPNGVTDLYQTFAYCTELKPRNARDIIISNSVVNMVSTFEGASLSSAEHGSIHIPNSVVNTQNAFAHTGLQSLSAVYLADTSVRDMSYMFINCHRLQGGITLPNSVTNLSHAFENCNDVHSAVAGYNNNIVIGNNVTDLSYAFANCKSIGALFELSNSITNMSHTFQGCSNIERATSVIPNSVTDLSYAFKSCINLISPPSTLGSVINLCGTFQGCNSLMHHSMSIPEGVRDMSFMFNGCTFLKDGVDIPNSVTNLAYAFAGCKEVQFSPRIPEHVTNLKNAFQYCFGLQDGSPDPVIKFHISHNIALRNTDNYIYNCLMNNYIGIQLYERQIVNDL